MKKFIPGGDVTGPWWAQERNWKYSRPIGFGRGVGWRYQQRDPLVESMSLAKDEPKKIVEDKLKANEQEKESLERQLKECDS